MLAVLAVMATQLWSGAPAADAHAALRESMPADRERLLTAPQRVELTFNEPVDAPTGGLRVLDADAERVDLGLTDTGDELTVAAALPSDLPEGGYVVTYRVLSADSHPINGALVFTIGQGPELDDAIVSTVFAAGAGWVPVASDIVRGLLYLASLIAAGAALFGWLVARRVAEFRMSRGMAVRAAWVGIVLSALAVPLQAASVTGREVLAVVGAGSVLGETLGSSFGWSTVVRVVALMLLIVSWRRPPPGTGTIVAAAVVPASFLLDGHQRTVEPLWLLVPADAIHLFAAAFWLAGVVLLGMALRRRIHEQDLLDATHLVARFSGLAGWSVLALAIGGIAMGWAMVRVPRAMVATDYGWLLTAKVVLAAVAISVAAYNRQRLVPAIQARVEATDEADVLMHAMRVQADRRAAEAWRQLRATLAVEAVVLVLVAVVTGFLVVQQPAAQAAGVTGAYVVTQPLADDLDVQLIVDPNRVGRNTMHVYVLDETGRPARNVDDVRLELTFVGQDIGPFAIKPFAAGPGHWTANVDQLLYPGGWTVRVVVGVGAFDEASTILPVNVNP